MILDPLTLVFRYTAFAIAAAGVNIMTQHVALTVYTESDTLWIGIFAGTVTGLLTKYLLDRHWIFYAGHGDIADHSRHFPLYTLMGGATTLIFWVTEWSFDYFSGGDEIWRYAGAIVGLALGYMIKYRLDKRFVFGERNL